jgi:hypothetical protein
MDRRFGFTVLSAAGSEGRRFVSRPHTLWAGLALAALPALTACESLTLRGEPDEARVQIESGDIGEVEIVVSQFFTQTPDPECPQTCDPIIELVESDTIVATVPYDEVYPFNFRNQIFVETYPVESDPATVTMRVWIDSDEWYNNFRQLLPADENGERETLRFVYQWRNPRL